VLCEERRGEACCRGASDVCGLVWVVSEWRMLRGDA
jgi:hypothetical protein